jgi:hypothetical protein
MLHVRDARHDRGRARAHARALVGRIGAANVYLGSSHDLLNGMVWYRGYLTIGFIRREMFDPTTLPLYGASRSSATRWRSLSSSCPSSCW